MSANAQALANYSGPIEQSGAVNFFRGTPRWPSSSTNFAFSFDYLTPVALTAVIPLIFAVILSLAHIIHLTVRFTCRSQSTDDRYNRQLKSRRSTIFLVPFSAILLTLIFVFTSFGLLGNATLNHSANDAVDVVSALLHDLSRSGFAIVDTSIFLRAKLVAFDPEAFNASSTLSEAFGDLITPTLRTLRDYMLQRYPNVSALREALEILRSNLLDVLNVVRRAVDITFGALLAIILLLLSAPPLLRAASARGVPRGCSVLAYVLYVFVPALLAWALVGVLSAVGAVVADLCVSVDEYRTVLRGGTLDANTTNALVESGFVCPSGLSGQSLQQQINDTAVSILQSDLARTTVQRLLDTPAEDIADAARWTASQVPRYLDCSAQVELTGQLAFIACGRAGRSAIDGVFNLWIAFLGLALCLAVAMSASLLGFNVMRSLDVWPRLLNNGSVNMDDIAPGQRFDLSKDHYSGDENGRAQ